MSEKNILEEAIGLVYGDRNKAYGHPSKNFQNVADLWNGYLSILYRERASFQTSGLTNIDIAALNILQKVARLATNPAHRDTIVDIAGYAATIERIVLNK